ncbi:MAG: metallophosphoesterase [Bacteroidetes bacterium]|nr:metallophosphoesterase [Bacteroidota bacterium]
MKRKDFLIFFSIVLSVYGLINFYIFVRAWSALAFFPEIRFWVITGGILLAAAYPLGRIVERKSLSTFTEVIIYVGALWLGEMVYLFLFTAVLDLLRAVNWLIPFFPDHLTINNQYAPSIAVLSIFSLSTLISLYGFINARFPKIKTLEFIVPKKNSPLQEFRIAAISDIHLGTIMGPKRLQYIIKKVNSLRADVVLLVGDVFDEDIGRVIKNNLGSLLRGMTSTYGTFAVTGNHEYIGGVEHAVRYLRENGITVLRDNAVEVGGGIILIGREDRSMNQWSGHQRKSLPELLEMLPHHLPTIVLDHQPFHLEEAANAGIDLQLSGHTHHGQLFPFNGITKKVYEVSWGYKKKSHTHVYVSCGAGSWGPPIRTGNTPEILSIVLRMQ